MPNAATQFITRTYSAPYRPAKLGRKDPIDPYKDFIQDLARKFTNSPEEADAAVQEMMTDIQQCGEKGILARSNEDRLVARIAWRRLLKFLQ